jgi:electron transport complex protein RnfG
MVRSLGGVGILCAVLIVYTFQATLPIIEKNKAEALERAIFHVLPGAKTRATFLVTADNRLEPFQGASKGERLVYVGYDDQGELVGVAMEAQGQGFQDTIRLIYGYAPAKQQVIGMEVLESRETPGLGDKIITNPDFVANFAALDVTLTEDGLKNPIHAVSTERRSNLGRLTASPAPLCRQCVANIMRTSAEQILPILAKQAEQLRPKGNE